MKSYREILNEGSGYKYNKDSNAHKIGRKLKKEYGFPKDSFFNLDNAVQINVRGHNKEDIIIGIVDTYSSKKITSTDLEKISPPKKLVILTSDKKSEIKIYPIEAGTNYGIEIVDV